MLIELVIIWLQTWEGREGRRWRCAPVLQHRPLVSSIRTAFKLDTHSRLLWPEFVSSLEELLEYGLRLHVWIQRITPVTQCHSWVGSTAACNWEPELKELSESWSISIQKEAFKDYNWRQSHDPIAALKDSRVCDASEVIIIIIIAGLPARSPCKQHVHLLLRWAPGWKEGSMRSL